jgi:hypothetical protein
MSVQSPVGAAHTETFRIIAHIRVLSFNHFDIVAMAGDSLRRGSGESAQLLTEVKEVLAVCVLPMMRWLVS